jgi:hypothetical protein
VRIKVKELPRNNKYPNPNLPRGSSVIFREAWDREAQAYPGVRGALRALQDEKDAACVVAHGTGAYWNAATGKCCHIVGGNEVEY